MVLAGIWTDSGLLGTQIEFVDVAMSGRLTSVRTTARFSRKRFYGESECVLSKPTGKPLRHVLLLLKAYSPGSATSCSTLESVAVEEGIAGAIPGSSPTYLALGHLYFESVDAFVQAWEPQGQEIIRDVSNYTNCEPIIQISTVKI